MSHAKFRWKSLNSSYITVFTCFHVGRHKASKRRYSGTSRISVLNVMHCSCLLSGARESGVGSVEMWSLSVEYGRVCVMWIVDVIQKGNLAIFIQETLHSALCTLHSAPPCSPPVLMHTTGTRILLL
jgi:hypothetical protein